MDDIQSEIVAGRYAMACKKIDGLLSWKADASGEINYLLGSCELARGRSPAAAAAWARIAPGSAFFERALVGRMRLLQASGELAAAEALVSSAARDPRLDRTALLVLLAPMYAELGCVEKAARLIEERWARLNAAGEGALEPALKLLRQHTEITLKPPPIEVIRGSVERAAPLASEDDLVLLGRANLALRAGVAEEAAGWLDACRARRPDDPAVWRAWLRSAMATNRVDIVQQAVAHLPTTDLDGVELHRCYAWLAALRRDLAAERRELELILAADPADMATIDQLAELARQQGDTGRAQELASRKAELDRLRARYLALHERVQPIRDSEEMARLAKQLGRRFEARAFATIAAAEGLARDKTTAPGMASP